MKRFEYNADGFSSLDESETGDWVRYEDHAAERAALAAQLEELGDSLDTQIARAESAESRVKVLEPHCQFQKDKLRESDAKVAELTRERDEARRQWALAEEESDGRHTANLALCAEVTRLTEALAAAERARIEERGRWEARVRELEAEVSGLREALALESELVTLHAGGASRAEVQVRELTERVSMALENPTTVEGLRSAVLEAIRAT